MQKKINAAHFESVCVRGMKYLAISVLALLALLDSSNCNDSYSRCGRNLELDGSTRRIVPGGRPNSESGPLGSLPWMASLGLRLGDGTWQHLCGGSLISDQFVLTAAHCIVSDELRIRLGDRDLSSKLDDSGVQERQISEESVIFHPKYVIAESYYDVALIRLNPPVTFSSVVRPICLPATSSTNRNEFEGDLVRVSGWGTSGRESNNPSDVLRVTKLRVFSPEYCEKTHSFPTGTAFQVSAQRALPQGFTSSVTCIGDDFDGFGSCKGDSGGPVIRRSLESDHFEQIAMVQGGIGACGDFEIPGIYVRLKDPEILDFIQQNLGLGQITNPNNEPGTTGKPAIARKSGPIHIAAKQGRLATVRTLLAVGTDINQQDEAGKTAFYWACRYNRVAVAEFLFEQGCDWRLPDDDGISPLWIASHNGQEDCVRLLVSVGDDVNQRNGDGYTPLHLAAKRGHVGTARALVEGGAEIDSQNRWGKTPFYWACRLNHLEMAEYLQGMGCDWRLEDYDGVSPLMVAANNGHEAIVNFILSLGS